MLSVYASVGRSWNDELAAFRFPPALAEPFFWLSWSGLEPSDGQDCKFGSIRWPRPEKAVSTGTYRRAQSYEPARACEALRSEDSRERPRIARLLEYGALSHCHQTIGG